MTARTGSAIRTGPRASTKPRAPRLRRARSSSSISTSADLARHLAYLTESWEAALKAPLSAKRLLLGALLADGYADRLFAAQAETDDILRFRQGLAHQSEALAQVFALVRGELRLVTEAVQVPLAEYKTLSVEDFMVSLYNDHSVQRVLLVAADGTRRPAHEVVGAAIAFLSRL